MTRDYLLGQEELFEGKQKEQWCQLHDDQDATMTTPSRPLAGETPPRCCGLENLRYNSRHSVAYLLTRATKRTNA
jgi:hypothetical protein